MNIVCFP